MRRQITSYKQALDIFNTCRSPSRGKPWGQVRLYQGNQGEIRFYMNWSAYVRKPEWPNEDYLLGVLTPDNVFTFTMSSRGVAMNATSLSMTMDRIVPVNMKRKKTGLYTLAPHVPREVEVNQGGDYRPYMYTTSNKYDPTHKGRHEYFEGIAFELNGDNLSVCINPRPDFKCKVDKVKRLEWLRKVRKFKRNLKVYQKMGLIDAYLDNEYAPDLLTSEAIRELVLDQLDCDEITADFVHTMYADMFRAYTSPVSSERFVTELSKYLKTNSEALRVDMGVLYK